MSHDPNIEQIIANLDRLLIQAPDKGGKVKEGAMPETSEPDAPSQPEQAGEFEFVEDEDLAEAARQAEEEAVDASETHEEEKRRILLTPDMQVADEQILLLDEEDIPHLSEQELLEQEAIEEEVVEEEVVEEEVVEEEVVEEALAYEAVTDEVMEAEAPEDEAPVEDVLAETEPDIQFFEQATVIMEIPEEDIGPVESSPEEAIGMSDSREEQEPIDPRALAERVCEDVLEKLREILPQMVENSVRRALEGQSGQPARGGENDFQR